MPSAWVPQEHTRELRVSRSPGLSAPLQTPHRPREGHPGRLAGHHRPTEGHQARGRTPREALPIHLQRARMQSLGNQLSGSNPLPLPPWPCCSQFRPCCPRLRALPAQACREAGVGQDSLPRHWGERPRKSLRQGDPTLDITLNAGPAHTIPQPAGPGMPGRATPSSAGPTLGRVVCGQLGGPRERTGLSDFHSW